MDPAWKGAPETAADFGNSEFCSQSILTFFATLIACNGNEFICPEEENSFEKFGEMFERPRVLFTRIALVNL